MKGDMQKYSPLQTPTVDDCGLKHYRVVDLYAGQIGFCVYFVHFCLLHRTRLLQMYQKHVYFLEQNFLKWTRILKENDIGPVVAHSTADREICGSNYIID